MGDEQLVECLDLGSGTHTGQHRLCVGHQLACCRFVALVYRFLPLLYRFLSLEERDDCCDDRDDGQNGQADDRGTPQAAEAALLAHILAGQFVLGLAMDRGGQVGDFVAETSVPAGSHGASPLTST